jgi:hypothetical protein
MTHPLLKKLLPLGLLLAACSGESGSTQPGNPPGPGGVYNPNPPNDPNPGSTLKPPGMGATDFTTEEAGGLNGQVGGDGRAGGPSNAAPGASPAPPSATSAEGAPMTPPGGRLADVEEADIYKVDKNRLFYLNTYKGFMIYDVNDTKAPKRVARLPVFGYPVEMFVSGNTVYALLRDALYLSQVGDKVQFERHNVSQLVTIDITDLANPKIIKKIDIIGQLREGVSRKVENTIYVVSYIPRTYYWGWRPDPALQKEKATVYSFNVADPQNVREVNKLQIFEGGSITVQEGNYSYDRSFSSVAISATSNALMVVENWNVSAYQGGAQGPRGSFGCGSYSSGQFARVSLVDISNPSGEIKLQAQFQTDGRLEDQFKMTYVHDAVANTGTYFGIFARQVWASAGCQGVNFTQNTLESWDVSVVGKPQKLDALDFGKKDELVRGSAFDTDRKVAYAITAQRIDPMYALSIANRRDLRVLSEIDGLSGEMSVFRLVGGKKFLLGVGTDNSGTCTGFQGSGTGFTPTKMAVSLIDVQDLTKIRLVQRRCVAIKGADWVGSGVSNNLDQAHKMLGMHADGDLNVITVPVHYSKRVDNVNDWWWYRWETAVGLMTWDLTKYDPLKPETQQTVIENFGTFVHPHGEVRRSIVFTHEAVTPRRMMINLSDTHVSIANLVDMSNPTTESVIEVAPYYNQIYRFGDYLVEQVQAKPQAWGSASQDVATFRVRKAGGPAVDDAPVLKSFDVGQVYRVFKHNESLVLFRQVNNQRVDAGGVYVPPSSEALVVDMRDPANPRLAGRTSMPILNFGYYRFWCGMSAYWGSYWFDQSSDFAITDRGLAFYSNQYEYQGPNLPGVQRNRLIFLDVRNPDAPVVTQKELAATTSEWGAYSLVSDPVAPAGFFVSHRKRIDEQKTATGLVYTRYKYYAQRWEPQGDVWAAKEDINIPGRLIRTWQSGVAGNAGARMFLTQDTSYREGFDGTNRYYLYDYRLSLLKAAVVQNKPAAELLDVRVLSNLYPSALLLDGDRLYLNGRPQMNYFGYYGRPATTTVSPDGSSAAAPLPSWETTSDRLMIFDLSGNKLDPKHDQPTRMYNVQLMGTHAGKLFINLAGNGQYYDYGYGGGGGGDGILVVDVTNPAAPKGVKFMRTLGLATHIEFFGTDVYVASGHFGLYHMDLASPPDLVISSM